MQLNIHDIEQVWIFKSPYISKIWDFGRKFFSSSSMKFESYGETSSIFSSCSLDFPELLLGEDFDSLEF